MRWGSRRDGDQPHGTFACGAALVVERQGQLLFDREAKATIRVLESLRQQVGRAGYCDINVFEDLRLVRDAVDNLADRVAKASAESIVPKVYRAFHNRSVVYDHRKRDRLLQSTMQPMDGTSFSSDRGKLGGMGQVPWHDMIRLVSDVRVEELCGSVVDLDAVLNGEDLNNKASESPPQKSKPRKSPHKVPRRPTTMPPPALPPASCPTPMTSRAAQPRTTTDGSQLWDRALHSGSRAQSVTMSLTPQLPRPPSRGSDSLTPQPAIALDETLLCTEAAGASPSDVPPDDSESPPSGQGLLSKLNRATPTPPSRPPSRGSDCSHKSRPGRIVSAGSRAPVADRAGRAEPAESDVDREAEATSAYVRRLLLRGGASLRKLAGGRRSPSRIAPGRALA